MKKEILIDNKKITIYYSENSIKQKSPVVIFNSFEGDAEELWNECNKMHCKDHILAVIYNLNWNDNLTPYYMKSLFKGNLEYLGKADEYIKLLEEKILPAIESVIEYNVENWYLTGYSLAGLFSIYALYKTDIFKRVASVSGSLWYEKFDEYILNNELRSKPEKVYFSVGDKEKNSRNKLLCTVEDKTNKIYYSFKNKEINCIFELNPGNHFQDELKRTTNAIKWILE